MAFNDIETSAEYGRPIAFYEFTLGATVWRYTSAEEDLTIGPNLWRRAPISDDGVRQTGEVANDALSIDGPSWIAPGQMFMSSAPSRAVQVTVYEKHDQDPEMVVRYVGEVAQVNYPTPGRCRVMCESLASTMRRQGLRLGWQRSCPYALYDPVTCRVDKALWAYPFTVLNISDFNVTIEVSGSPGLALAAAGSNYLNNGFFEWDHPIRGVETVAIEAHVFSGGSTHVLTAFGEPGELFIGATGTAYRGCAFTPEACQSFNNYDNYGGHPDLPGRSIFDGNPTF